MAQHPLWLLAAALAGCSAGDMCGNRDIRAIASPDGSRAALMFVRDCGATARASTQISILPPGERPDAAGNIFIAETIAGGAVSVAWFGTNRLRIRYARGANVFKRVTTWEGVRIVYDLSDAAN